MDMEKEKAWMFRILFLLALATNVSTAAMVVLIAAGSLILLAGAWRRRQILPVDLGMVKAVLLYLALWGICSIGARDPIASLHAVLGTSYRFLPLFFALSYIWTRKQVRALVLAFAVSVCMNDMAALGQSAMHMGTSWRPTGLVHTPTFLGSHMLMAIPVLFFFSRKSYFRPAERYFLLVNCKCKLNTNLIKKHYQ